MATSCLGCIWAKFMPQTPDPGRKQGRVHNSWITEDDHSWRRWIFGTSVFPEYLTESLQVAARLALTRHQRRVPPCDPCYTWDFPEQTRAKYCEDTTVKPTVKSPWLSQGE